MVFLDQMDKLHNFGHQTDAELRNVSAKGVFGGPSGPSREGPGVGHKIVSDTKQMTKERKKMKKK